VNDERGHVEGHASTLADEGHTPPGTRRAQRKQARCGIAGALDRRLEAPAIGARGQLVRLPVADRDAEPGGDLPPGLDCLDAHHLRAECAGQQRRSDADRPEAGDQHAVTAGDVHSPAGRVGGAEAAGDHGAVEEGERLGERHQRALLGQQVRRVAAVALPAICRSALARARDHPAGAAVGAQPAAGDVIDHDPVTGHEAGRPRADGLHLATRLVAGDDTAVGLGSLALVGRPVDGPQVAAADARCAHPDQDLAVARLRHVELPNLELAIPGQDDARHGPHAAAAASSRR
jgi:hypothetical protein